MLCFFWTGHKMPRKGPPKTTSRDEKNNERKDATRLRKLEEQKEEKVSKGNPPYHYLVYIYKFLHKFMHFSFVLIYYTHIHMYIYTYIPMYLDIDELTHMNFIYFDNIIVI
jgi:hypothetical protein